MVFYFYRKLLLPFALGLFYAGTDLVVIEAQNLCQSTENLQLVALCSAMPGEEFHHPTELASFRKIRERLTNSPFEVWLRISGDWVKVLGARHLNNISAQGLAFEASIHPDKPDEFDIFHICKSQPCSFKGTTFGKSVTFHHITSISIRPLGEDNSPVPQQASISTPSEVTPSAPRFPPHLPSASPRSILVGSKFLYVSLAVVSLGLLLRFKQALTELDLGKLLEGQLEAGITCFLDYTIGIFVRVESALIKSICNILWPDHVNWIWAPGYPVFPWLVRAVLIVLFFARNFIPFRALYSHVPSWFAPSKNTHKITPTPRPLDQPPAAPKPLKKSPSELAYEAGITTCQAYSINFTHDRVTRMLSTSSCSDTSTSCYYLVPEDQNSTSCKPTTLKEPSYLCKFHSDIYLSLKKLKLCVIADCQTLLNKDLVQDKCQAHSADLPSPPQTPSVTSSDGAQKPNVKFADSDRTVHPERPKLDFYDGLGTMSPLLIQQAIREAWDLGLSTELEASRHLTLTYGGLLLDNAALVEQHWPILGPKPTPKPDTTAATAPAGAPPLFTHKIPQNMSASIGLTPPQQPTIRANTYYGGCGGGYSPLRPAPGVIPPQPTINTPIQTSVLGGAFETTVCHHLDKIAHPEVTTKAGSLESIKRMGGIWVYCARGFDTFPVYLCPGIVGKQLALQLKALNSQLWTLHEHLAIPVALTNKLRLGAALMGWGGGDSDPAWTLGEADFVTWSPSELDNYRPPPDWTLEPKKPKSVTLETWRRNALNQALVFALIYGNTDGVDLPHLAPRRVAIEKLYQLHLSNPNKYTLRFATRTWESLNSKWVLSLKENVNRLCLLRKVERPTFEELKETGLSLDPYGNNIYSLPNTFDLESPTEYFHTQILGALERDFDRTRWGQYYRNPSTGATRNAGDVDMTTPMVYGPSLNSKERRICALNSPKTLQGHIICWDFNSHLGCNKKPCPRCDGGGKATFRNPETLCGPLRIYLAKRGGSKDAKEFQSRRSPAK